jgi:geranylgeranyl diphosphate synthase, type II
MYTLKELQGIIQKEFSSLEFRIAPYELYEPIEYILSIGGKRLRPLFMVLSCNMFNEDIEKAMKPAIAIEIFHNFTLLHDDIMDNAPLRRNHPTVHTRWDNNTAILSGDAMCIKAYQYLALSDKNILSLLFDLFNQTALKVCEGQQYDMNFERVKNVSESEYLKMIELKTAVLIAASVKIGALTGGSGTVNADKLYEFGRNIGMAFQLQDDLLDVYGDSAIFGKKTGGDIVSNKKTYLLIKAFEKADPTTLSALKNLMDPEVKAPADKVAQVTAIYDKLVIKEETERTIESYYQAGLDAFEAVKIDLSRKKELLSFTNSLMVRKN